MDPARARTTLLVALAATGLVELVGVQTGAVWEPFARFLWAALLAGPGLLVLLHGAMLADGRRWLRAAAWAVPVLSVLVVARETVRFVGLDAAPEVADHARGLLVFHLCLAALTLLVAGWTLRRADRWGWKAAGATALVGGALALTPLRDVTFLALVGAQAASFVALAGFHRAPAAWGRAALAAAAVLLLGGVGLVAAYGSFLPSPRLRLDEDAATLAILPVVALAALVFLGVLLAARAPPQSPTSGALRGTSSRQESADAALAVDATD